MKVTDRSMLLGVGFLATALTLAGCGAADTAPNATSDQSTLTTTAVAPSSSTDVATTTSPAESTNSTFDVTDIEIPNSCELLTAEDVEAIVGVPVVTLELGGSCQYDGEGIALKANVRPSPDPVRAVQGSLDFTSSERTTEAIDGVGDIAGFYIESGIGEATFEFASGPYLVQIRNRDGVETTYLRELGELIVDKLPASE